MKKIMKKIKKMINRIKILFLLILLSYFYKKYKNTEYCKNNNLLKKEKYKKYFIFSEDDLGLNKSYLDNFDRRDRKYSTLLKKYFKRISYILYNLDFDSNYIEKSYYYNIPISFSNLLKNVHIERLKYLQK